MKRGQAIVDPELLDALLPYTWHRTKDDYIESTIYKDGKRKCVLLHKCVAFLGDLKPLPHQTALDHINHNRWDNRLVNLRWVSSRENCYNRVKSAN